jgi:outer membrane protein
MKYLLSLTIISVILATFTPSQAAAQTAAQTQAQPATQPTLTWTLDRCVLYAVEHSPETGIRAAQNDIARQDYREAIANLLPSVNASVGARFNFGRNTGEDNTYVDANSFDNSYGIGSGLTIFGGLRSINNIRLARINRTTGGHRLDQARDEVAFATMEAFFNVMYYKKMVVLAESQLEESRLNLRQTERMTELGIKGFPDVAEMRAKEAADSYLLTQQQNELAIGVILLKERMNFPLADRLDIVPYDMAEDVFKSPESAAGLYARALDYLPKALGAASAAEASRVSLQIARGARYPTLSLDAGINTGFYHVQGSGSNTSFAHQFSGKRGYYVGASLNIPIFNGLATSSNIKRSKYQLSIAQMERDATLRSLYSEIERAVADMNGQADQYAQAVRQREYTSVAHDVNRRKYDEGLVSALELHTSSNRLVQARADELRSRLVWILKKRMVDYYSGIPLWSPEPETSPEN